MLEGGAGNCTCQALYIRLRKAVEHISVVAEVHYKEFFAGLRGHLRSVY